MVKILLEKNLLENLKNNCWKKKIDTSTILKNTSRRIMNPADTFHHVVVHHVIHVDEHDF